MNADSKISSPAADAPDVTSGDINFYTNGRHMLKTQSSVMISSSPFLNDARIREWTATESLRRNGVDYPLLFGMMPLLEGIWASRDVAYIETLFDAERKAKPHIDAWMSEGFLSNMTLEALEKNPEGSLGRLLHDYMVEKGLSPELAPQVLNDPNLRPKSGIEYWDFRMSQTHDFYHILGEVGFGVTAEYFVTGFVTGNVFKHFSPELASKMMCTNTLIMFPWMTRCMLHYGEAWPMLWHNITHGYEMGLQSDLVVTRKFEEVLHLAPAAAREALGMRGFRGPVNCTPSSLVFGEGREIF